jgi:hypothetical protein
MTDARGLATPSSIPGHHSNMSQTATDGRRKCICNWEHCSQITETISRVAEEGDVWKGNFIAVGTPAKESHKVTALRESIAYHLKVDKEIADKRKSFCVARHHWSRSLLRKLGKGHRTKLVTEAEVKGFDSEDGHSRHQEECNLFLIALRRGFTGGNNQKI